MSTEPASSWWARAWANRKGIGTAIGVVLMFISPFLPAQYQGPAKAVQHLVEHVAGDEPSSSSSSSPASSCREGAVQSLPHFCKCVDGAWRDYFDVDAGCPED